MKIKIISKPLKTYFLLIFLASCSSTVDRNAYPIELKKYRDDLVSVQTALNLAKSSYLKGCADKAIEEHQKDFFQDCLSKADEHVEKNIVFILDQPFKE